MLREDISLETLEKVLKEYKKNKEHPYEEYCSQFTVFQKGQGEEYFPVYYSDINKNGLNFLMLSPACITREIYNTKIKDMIGEYRPCSNKNNLCPACALFGTVKTNGRGEAFAVTSRIRFSDLTCQEESAEMCYGRQVTLPPLSSPKLNNMEFYLQRPAEDAEDAVFWTYDYYINTKGEINPNKNGINGRKFFWHNLSFQLDKLESYKPSNQNMTIRPVKEGVAFAGKLYFQNLTKTALDQLIFVLNAGDEAQLREKNHGYKLGGAKPLGLGSIAISVDEVMLRKIVKTTETRSVERRELAFQGYDVPK
ncbi:MAG: TIGR03986 family CRISPR-associated RAMP protein, partial [Lachnospiraceae bacterium]|nr:TIGR03986 family CRISPR-associated RAMP protein [Lachnospiraceae bacterium]